MGEEEKRWRKAVKKAAAAAWRNLARRLKAAASWARWHPVRTKVALGVAGGALVLLLLWLFDSDHYRIFALAEVSHAAGIAVLVYKLVKERTCAGFYVFALGFARFLNCAHWILQVFSTYGRILAVISFGLWPCMVFLSEIVQTFILADFCYYYVKCVVEGKSIFIP